MDRRTFFLGAASGVASLALARGAFADTHAGHGHAHAAAASAGAARDERLTALCEALRACQQTADDCVRHCVAALSAGDTSLASCMQSVLRMQSVTRATCSVIGGESQPSALGRDLVAVCADFCDACAKECEPHASMHATCKACLEACRRCIEACDGYAAA